MLDIDANPEVCLQIEKIHDPLQQHSVIVNGRADRLTEQQNINHAMQFIKEHNPTLSPAIDGTWVDSWGCAEGVAIDRLHPSEMSGRTTEGVSSQSFIIKWGRQRQFGGWMNRKCQN